MQPSRRLVWAVCVLFTGCQAAQGKSLVVLEEGQDAKVVGRAASVEASLTQAGVEVAPEDRILVRGFPVQLGEELADSGAGPIQIVRAMHVTINGKTEETTASTVGEVIAEAGNELYAADLIEPPAGTSVADGMQITYTPSRPLTLSVDGGAVRIRSAATMVGQALADAGIPAIGLDATEPADDQAITNSSEIRLSRIAEAVLLSQQAIPFDITYQDSPQVALGQQQVLQPGSSGLQVARTRVRYEDGREIDSKSDAAAIVYPPHNRVVARGTKIVNQTLNVNGAAVEYWLQTQMYATVYSPCESASGGCSYGTASGLRAGKGVVAVDPALFAYLNGQRLYIPGYGYAVIGDIGGGYIVEQKTGVSRYKWIDLGFDDGNIEDMSGWITVYFLAPAPANIPDALK